MDEGWSIKKLHRLIMLSGVYMQSSGNNPTCAKADPNNQLLWRMNRQRLEFEAMRDTILAVDGKLDLTQGGHAVDIGQAVRLYAVALLHHLAEHVNAARDSLQTRGLVSAR